MSITLDGSTGISVSGNNNLSIGTLAAGNTTITGTLAANSTNITGNVSVTGTQFVNGVVTFANSTANSALFYANGMALLSTVAVSGGAGFSGSYTSQQSQGISLGSDTSNSYIQSWGSRQLIINPQGNPVGVYNSGSSPTMFFAANGQVGINTAFPAKLTGSVKSLTIDNAGSTYSGLELSVANNRTFDFLASNTASYISTRTNTPIIFQTNEVDVGRITGTGVWMINTANNTTGGFENKLIVKQTGSTWTGGIGVEAASNDHIISMGSNATHHIIAGSYRTLSGYKPIVLQSGQSNSLIIDTSGRVLTPYRPGFSAYSPAGATSQYNEVVYGQTRYNQGSHYNTSTGRFTAPVAGLYHFSFNALMNVNGAYARMYFNYNGTRNATLGDTLVGGTSGTNGWNEGYSYVSLGMSLSIYLNANEYIGVWNDGPSTTYGTDYGTFSGFLVG